MFDAISVAYWIALGIYILYLGAADLFAVRGQDSGEVSAVRRRRTARDVSRPDLQSDIRGTLDWRAVVALARFTVHGSPPGDAQGSAIPYGSDDRGIDAHGFGCRGAKCEAAGHQRIGGARRNEQNVGRSSHRREAWRGRED